MEPTSELIPNDRIGEKCAVAGAVGKSAHSTVVEILYALQHRGSEASGMACRNKTGDFNHHRGLGMVPDIFYEKVMEKMEGSFAVGHNRYSTNGSKFAHQQPVVDEQIGFAFAHNGNIPVVKELESYLKQHGYPTKEFNDSELLGLSIAQKIREGYKLGAAIEEVMPMVEGAFSCVAMHNGYVAAFRDKFGIRPLVYGKTESGYAIASETCGLDIIGASDYKEIEPGELIVFSENGIALQKSFAKPQPKLDIFEFVYFARPDSFLYGKRVNGVRREFGNQLAKEHADKITINKDTLVVPVPDSSIPAAEGFAEAVGALHRQSLIKNRFVGRTFMKPSQKSREKHLLRKHNLMAEEVKGKHLVLIDDSIVRLNTMPRIVAQAWKHQAKTVTVLISSPPVRYPDFYGIDLPDQKYLGASKLTANEMQKEIGATYLGFLSLSGMVNSTGMPKDRFNLSIFDGNYPIKIGDRNRKNIKEPASFEYLK